jgi:hypothetical protein
MSDFTTSVRNRFVDYVRGAGAPAAIAGLFLDLYNGDPQGAGASVLATITGSANRASVGASFGAAANGLTQNTAVITPTAAAVAAGTVTHVAFFDAATGGNLIASHALTSGTLTVNSGNGVQFNTGALTLSIN